MPCGHVVMHSVCVVKADVHHHVFVAVVYLNICSFTQGILIFNVSVSLSKIHLTELCELIRVSE